MRKEPAAVLLTLLMITFFLSETFALGMVKPANPKEKQTVVVTHKQCQDREPYQDWMIHGSAQAAIALNEACDKIGESEVKKKKESSSEDWDIMSPKTLAGINVGKEE